MTKIKPVKYDDLKKKFGPACSRKGMVKESLPFPMFASWDRNLVIRSFYGHEYIAGAVLEALAEIEEYYGLQYIRDEHLDIWGGCYSDRKARGLQRWSVHAWGMAIDILPGLAPLGEPSMLPAPIEKAFTKRGFISGAYWERHDGQHMTAVLE